MICTGAIQPDGTVTHDGATCPTHEAAFLALGTRRGVNRGLVYDCAGHVVGRVFPTNRKLRADMGGGRGTAWTAYVRLPDGDEPGCSLGTRHPDRWSAVRAIRTFWLGHPTLYRAAPSWEAKRPLHRALLIFKYDRHEVCGLTARYRGGDPRKMWA